MRNSRYLPYALILIAGSIWGATFSLTLIATADGAHPIALTAWQFLLTAIFYLIVCKVSRIPFFKFKNLRYYLVVTAVGIILPTLFYFYAAPHLSAGILSITVSIVPMVTYAMMLAMRFERAAMKRIFGIVLGMIAILLLVLPDQGLSSEDANLWILLVLLSAVLYSVENIYIARGVPNDVDLRELLCGSNIIASLIQFPLAIAMGVVEPVSWLFSDAGMALAGIALGSGIAYALFFYAIKLSGPVFASQCAYIVTLSGVLWGILIFAEVHSFWVWSSVVVMMLGLVLVTPDRKADSIGELAETKV
ncbi:MAG: drug/metabolite transporter (DMT)-like permease [Planctomycetota bacterium]|jgi:drug/metabolite transporter (DMT)-like permease